MTLKRATFNPEKAVSPWQPASRMAVSVRPSVGKADRQVRSHRFPIPDHLSESQGRWLEAGGRRRRPT